MINQWSRRGLLTAGGASLACWPLRSALAAAPTGFGAAGIAALHGEMRALVDQQRLAGFVTLMAHRGRIADFDAYGRQDATTPAAMRTDSIFRIASMTKPVIGVAMMQLYERGLWRLDDPVAKHIPEFVGLKVRTADGGLTDPASPMMMWQLMSHMAGFADFRFYIQHNVASGTLAEMIARLATLPLDAQPGTAWVYGPAVDVQGYLVEKLSGLRLDAYLQRHIFDPLGMPDTQFWVDPAKLGRTTRLHGYHDGKVVLAAAAPVTPTAPPSFLSGSGGLYSTASDYFRFAQSLLAGGRLGDTRILRKDSVRLLHTNVVPAGVRVKVGTLGDNGLGFGLDFAISERPELSGSPMGRGSYWWMGSHGTMFWIDPLNEIIFVGMVPNYMGFYPNSEMPDLRNIWPNAVYSAFRGSR